jgi:hypothetical protein
MEPENTDAIEIRSERAMVQFLMTARAKTGRLTGWNNGYRT